MPELPEVETTRRGIAVHTQGRKITDVIVRNPHLRWPVSAQLRRKLIGSRILSITRRAKYLLFETDAGHMIVHLGMSGSLRIDDDSRTARLHDHIEWVLDNKKHLRLHDPRRFGSVHWTTQPLEKHFLLCDLGPEPLSSEFSGELLYRLSRKRKTAVKNFIMNSKIVVGIGNIYASEALFLAGIMPTRAANRISRPRYDKLAEAIKTILHKAIQQGGTTLRDFVNAQGQPGYFRQQLNVYEKSGDACNLCGNVIRQKVIGQRSSYYCSHCQG